MTLKRASPINMVRSGRASPKDVMFTTVTTATLALRCAGNATLPPPDSMSSADDPRMQHYPGETMVDVSAFEGFVNAT